MTFGGGGGASWLLHLQAAQLSFLFTLELKEDCVGRATLAAADTPSRCMGQASQMWSINPHHALEEAGHHEEGSSRESRTLPITPTSN